MGRNFCTVASGTDTRDMESSLDEGSFFLLHQRGNGERNETASLQQMGAMAQAPATSRKPPHALKRSIPGLRKENDQPCTGRWAGTMKWGLDRGCHKDRGGPPELQVYGVRRY